MNLPTKEKKMYRMKFDSLAERIAYKKREHQQKRWMIQTIDEADRSIASLVTAVFLSLGIFFLFAVIITIVRG